MRTKPTTFLFFLDHCTISFQISSCGYIHLISMCFHFHLHILIVHLVIGFWPLSGPDLLQNIECVFEYDSPWIAGSLGSTHPLPVHSLNFTLSFIFQCFVINSLILSELINGDMIVFNYEVSQLLHSILSHVRKLSLIWRQISLCLSTHY